jgi:hypothetical protein
VGSVDAILEKLHVVHEQFGINYWVIHAPAMNAFAPVIARIA